MNGKKQFLRPRCKIAVKKRQEAATLCTYINGVNVYTSPMYFGSFFTHCKRIILNVEGEIWVKFDRKSVIG